MRHNKLWLNACLMTVSLLLLGLDTQKLWLGVYLMTFSLLQLGLDKKMMAQFVSQTVSHLLLGLDPIIILSILLLLCVICFLASGCQAICCESIGVGSLTCTMSLLCRDRHW